MTAPPPDPPGPAFAPVIAVDGPAASGKGTLARRLAEAYGFAHLDTGLLYRLVGIVVLEQGDDPSDAPRAEATAWRLAADLPLARLGDPHLRGDRAAAAASRVAAIPGVRAALLDLQRGFAANPPGGRPGAVLDGRDIGTVVAPWAAAKLFIDAAVGVRAERRCRELRARGIGAMYGVVLQDLMDRDARDSGRAVAPLRPAEGAFVLDTSDMDADQAFAAALRLVVSVLGPVPPTAI